MTVLLRKSMVALTGVLILISVAARQPAAQSPATPAPAPVVDNAGYVGADDTEAFDAIAAHAAGR